MLHVCILYTRCIRVWGNFHTKKIICPPKIPTERFSGGISYIGSEPQTNVLIQKYCDAYFRLGQVK